MSHLFPVQTKKLTTDRLQRKQSTCAQYIVHLFYSPFPERRTEKKVTAIKTGKPTMTDQQHQARRTAAGPNRSIKSPSCTLIEQFKFEIFWGKKQA
jgi:hypothetical protein